MKFVNKGTQYFLIIFLRRTYPLYLEIIHRNPIGVSILATETNRQLTSYSSCGNLICCSCCNSSFVVTCHQIYSADRYVATLSFSMTGGCDEIIAIFKSCNGLSNRSIWERFCILHPFLAVEGSRLCGTWLIIFLCLHTIIYPSVETIFE